MALFKFFALLCLLLSASYAQSGLGSIDEDYVEDVKVGASPDVETSYVFPRYPDNALPLGKPLEVVFGFKNNGFHTFNVTVFYASLMYPQAPEVHMQNFTVRRQNQIVRSGESWSFSYWFMPDPLLEPKDYYFVGSVEYKDEDNTNFTSTWFKDSIVLVEAESALDMATIFSSLLGFAILGGAAFVVFKTFVPTPVAKVYKSKKNNGAVKKEKVVDNDWGNNNAIGQWNKQKSAAKNAAKKTVNKK
eukprot:TRINITY_DN13233_c0_g1_i1.p1 TRINITY_DN13233_c0_g1~~TRINITY_DN13233_c0_g1_i1.p1  ORF type:complete len:246 (-),score=68.42 TRINITY_DN13233_c0_g1_i1:94-831(-)